MGDPDNTGYARLLVAPGIKADFGTWTMYADAEHAASTREFARRWWASGLRYVPTPHDTPMDLFVASGTAWHYRSPDLGWPAVHAGEHVVS